MEVTGLIGIAGFVLSIIVFIITRIEGRKRLLLHLYCSHGENKFKAEIEKNELSFVILQVVNIGPKSIFVDENSFTIHANNIEIKHDTNWFGLKNIPAPINPGQSFEVGVTLNSFEELLGISKEKNKIIEINAYFSDIQKKKYKTKNKHIYLQEVGEIDTK